MPSVTAAKPEAFPTSALMSHQQQKIISGATLLLRSGFCFLTL